MTPWSLVEILGVLGFLCLLLALTAKVTASLMAIGQELIDAIRYERVQDEIAKGQ
jgi:hypothetical protein